MHDDSGVILGLGREEGIAVADPGRNAGDRWDGLMGSPIRMQNVTLATALGRATGSPTPLRTSPDAPAKRKGSWRPENRRKQMIRDPKTGRILRWEPMANAPDSDGKES